MSERRKRQLDSSSDSSSSCGESSKRREVQKKTVQEWISQYDKQFNTAVWLKFDMVDRTCVSTLRCSVCTQFQKQLESMRNFRPAFIDGTTNVRISTVKDHAGTDMHARAMLLYKKAAIEQHLRLLTNRSFSSPVIYNVWTPAREKRWKESST